MRNIRWVLRFAITVLVSGSSYGRGTPFFNSTNPTTDVISFVQIADPDLFDAGKDRHGSGVYEEALDNRAALHWAVQQTNRLVAEGVPITFVVFTGDWGLENVRLTGSPTNSLAAPICKCPRKAPQNEGPIEAASLSDAVAEVANEIRGLTVHTIFFIPGDADLCEGSPRDLHRYADFINALSKAIVDYTLIDLTRQNAPYELGNFALIGINSASFGSAARFNKVNSNQPGNPQFELDRLGKFLSSSVPSQGGSYGPKAVLLFTHIPDLRNPVAGSAEQTSLWEITAKQRTLWDSIIVRSQVLGIFGGHLHVPDQTIYATPASGQLAMDKVVGAKTRVAPPITVSGQVDADQKGKLQARGFLLVTVTDSGSIQTTPQWFAISDQKTALAGYSQLALGLAEQYDGHWDTAASKYLEAMNASLATPRTYAIAQQRFLNARMVTGTWWWQLGSYLPFFRWWWIHPIRCYVLVGCAFLLLVSPSLFKGRGLLSRAGQAVLLLRPKFTGRARVLATVPLTASDTTQSQLFAAQLPHGAVEVRRRLARVGSDFLSSSVTLLALPSNLTDQTIQSLPEIKSVDVSKIAKAVLLLSQYFGWRLETQIAYSAPPLTSDGTNTQVARVRAYGSLRWGWSTEAFWRVERIVRDSQDIESAAFGIAARAMGRAFK